jgi:hypothetical protein
VGIDIDLNVSDIDIRVHSNIRVVSKYIFSSPLGSNPSPLLSLGAHFFPATVLIYEQRDVGYRNSDKGLLQNPI